MSAPVFQISSLTVTAGPRKLLSGVSFDIPPGGVFGLIGPSGAGKSTLLKCLNRLIVLTPGLRVSGQIRFQGSEIYASGVNGDDLRTRIGMLFQQPVVFPKSILANVLFGVRHLGRIPSAEWPTVAEEALRSAALWDEVKDRLKQPAGRLSTGQQQRLCLARTLASRPEVILMDEPTSALDPRSTEAIEDLILHLKTKHSIVLVTHNLRQARRVCDRVAFIAAREESGQILACGTCAEVLARGDVPELTAYTAEM